MGRPTKADEAGDVRVAQRVVEEATAGALAAVLIVRCGEEDGGCVRGRAGDGWEA